MLNQDQNDWYLTCHDNFPDYRKVSAHRLRRDYSMTYYCTYYRIGYMDYLYHQAYMDYPHHMDYLGSWSQMGILQMPYLMMQ